MIIFSLAETEQTLPYLHGLCLYPCCCPPTATVTVKPRIRMMKQIPSVCKGSRIYRNEKTLKKDFKTL